jgi:ADP-ribose pyrophosphatase
MESPRKVVVHARRRVFDGFFKLDELTLTHEKFDGSMSGERKLLVFERGDAAAVLLYNRDTGQVILVEQLKAPTIEKSKTGGWILEVTAGMIKPGETAEQAIIRETLEETGYSIKNPELIASFFSSPGGSSERIFLYYAVVCNKDVVDRGGGTASEGEDIRLVAMSPKELFSQLRQGALDDPKLIIAAYHLRERLNSNPPPKPSGPG